MKASTTCDTTLLARGLFCTFYSPLVGEPLDVTLVIHCICPFIIPRSPSLYYLPLLLCRQGTLCDLLNCPVRAMCLVTIARCEQSSTFFVIAAVELNRGDTALEQALSETAWVAGSVYAVRCAVDILVRAPLHWGQWELFDWELHWKRMSMNIVAGDGDEKNAA